eukprot:TRINITY_DN26380_c0_g1_i1.p1 TRINITY_DN26380_c0_g1~~TRINITY_DN26380_c0_g1_i1.p1  ORF type:complete len:446 (+),score=133.34 TRINITY_DN26380_c0_g1_i1:126-1463(+)
MSTESEIERLKGNAIFARVSSDETLDINKKIDAMTQASQHYRTALAVAKLDKDKRSSLKNLAVSTWNLGDFFAFNNMELGDVLAYWMNALDLFCRAHYVGVKSFADARWVNTLKENILGKAEEIEANFMCESVKDTYEVQYKVQKTILATPTLIDIGSKLNRKLSRWLLNKAVIDTEASKFKDGMVHLEHCRYHLETSAQYFDPTGESDDGVAFWDDINDIRDSCAVQMAICEASQTISNADAHLDQIIHTSDEVNVDAVWDVLDTFKSAVIQTKDRNIEIEIKGLSRIGVVYRDVLKKRDDAERYHQQAVDLGKTQWEKVRGKDFYRECEKTVEAKVERLAEEQRKADEEAWAPFRTEMADELKALDEADTSMGALIEFIYKTYPPKVGMKTLPEDFDKTAVTRSFLKKVAAAYHVDKNPEPEKWKFTCNCISVKINKYITTTK